MEDIGIYEARFYYTENENERDDFSNRNGILKRSHDNDITNGQTMNKNLNMEYNGDYFETISNSEYINDESLIKNLSTSFDRYLEENYKKRNGNSK